MDLRLNEEQELVKGTAREFLQNECPRELVRTLPEDPKGYSPELWQKMAELGLMGVCFPEEYGGTGQGFLELCLLIEEQGRFCLPSPFFSTVVLCGLPVRHRGPEKRVLERDHQRRAHPVLCGDGGGRPLGPLRHRVGRNPWRRGLRIGGHQTLRSLRACG